MDATTQLANDMHFLTAPLRFIWRSILIFLLLFFAPLLYWTIPFACIAVDPNSDFRMLVFAYMALGPFVSAFWTMIVCMVRRYRRMTSDGRPYQRSLGVAVNAAHWNLWFASAGFAVFSPIFLLLGWRLLKSVFRKAGGN
jgi:hypothetical protein